MLQVHLPDTPVALACLDYGARQLVTITFVQWLCSGESANGSIKLGGSWKHMIRVRDWMARRLRKSFENSVLDDIPHIKGSRR